MAKPKKPAPSPDGSMSLLDHLTELRLRLLRSVLALFVTLIPGSLLAEPALYYLTAPLAGSARLIAMGPTDPMIIYFKVALFLAFILALPFILYQLYAFIAPGLLPSERHLILLAIPAVLILFILGAFFTLSILVPLSLPMLQSILLKIVDPIYTLDTYLSFITTLAFWMGLIFQTPLVIWTSVRIGLVTPNQLRTARRFVILIAAIVAAVITPTLDPFTMLLVTGPFVALYEVGLLLARIGYRYR